MRYSMRARLLMLLAPLAVILIIAGGCAYDLLLPYVYTPPCSSASIVVFDATGLVKGVGLRYAKVVNGFTIPTFLSMGKCGSRAIVIVSHGLKLVSTLSLPRGSFALETSEPASALAFLEYPLYILLEGVVRGESFGSSEVRLAVTSRMIPFMSSLDGKIVVLLTCPMGRIGDFAKALAEKGCALVAYPKFDVSESSVAKLLIEVVKALHGASAEEAAKNLERLGFVVIRCGR